METAIVEGRRADLLDITEAAAYIGLSVSTIRKKTSENKIPHIKIFRRVFYPRAMLDDFIDAHIVKARLDD